MDEDQIQLHPSKDDGFNDNETNNETEVNEGEADNKQEDEEDLPAETSKDRTAVLAIAYHNMGVE